MKTRYRSRPAGAEMLFNLCVSGGVGPLGWLAHSGSCEARIWLRALPCNQRWCRWRMLSDASHRL